MSSAYIYYLNGVFKYVNSTLNLKCIFCIMDFRKIECTLKHNLAHKILMYLTAEHLLLGNKIVRYVSDKDTETM